MASNSRPSSSICSAVSRASGLSMSLVLTAGPLSELDDDAPFRRVDAGTDHLPFGAGDLSVAQVPDLALAQLADARVADALAAAVGQVEALVLAGDEDRRAPVGLDLLLGGREDDRAALALLGEAELGLEALHVQAVAVAVGVPVVGHRVEQLAGAGDEGLALAPVRAQPVEVARRDALALAGEPQRDVQPLVRVLEALELVTEDDVVLGAGRVDVDDVVQAVARGEVAQHA